MAFRKGNLHAKCSLGEAWLIKSWEILPSKMRVHEKTAGVLDGRSWAHLLVWAWRGKGVLSWGWVEEMLSWWWDEGDHSQHHEIPLSMTQDAPGTHPHTRCTQSLPPRCPSGGKETIWSAGPLNTYSPLAEPLISKELFLNGSSSWWLRTWPMPAVPGGKERIPPHPPASRVPSASCTCGCRQLLYASICTAEHVTCRKCIYLEMTAELFSGKL